jgi:Protein kinase domain
MKAAFGPGTTLSNYRVDSLLGRGGMGVVYLAHDESLERPVALKLIAPELLQDEEFRARFLREPKLAASLDHPNVIPIYEAGEQEGQLYLAMRYVKGTDLRRVLERDGTLSPERTIEILSQVAGALDAAHERGLVHRACVRAGGRPRHARHRPLGWDTRIRPARAQSEPRQERDPGRLRLRRQRRPDARRDPGHPHHQLDTAIGAVAQPPPGRRDRPRDPGPAEPDPLMFGAAMVNARALLDTCSEVG